MLPSTKIPNKLHLGSIQSKGGINKKRLQVKDMTLIQKFKRAFDLNGKLISLDGALKVCKNSDFVKQISIGNW